MREFSYVRDYYGVPAEIGRRVVVDGQSGIIAEDRGHHIGVNFDRAKPGVISPCHPTWRVEYGEMGVIRPATKSQQRYKRFLEFGDSFESFIEFCPVGCEPRAIMELTDIGNDKYMYVQTLRQRLLQSKIYHRLANFDNY